MYVSVAILQALSRAALAQGISAEALRNLGLGDSLPPSPVGAVPVRCVTAALEQLVLLRPDLPTALRAGADLSPRALNLAGLTMITAHTLRALLEACVRFAPLILKGALFELTEEEELAHLSFTLLTCSGAASLAATEIVFGYAGTLARDLRSGVFFRRASVSHAAPSYAQAYEELLRCPVHFGSARNRLSFDRQDLEVEIPGGDKELHHLLCVQAQERILTQQDADDSPLSHKIRTLLACQHVLAIESVAAHFEISVSTLQRRLKQEGTTFTLLVDQVRREIALHAMTSSDAHVKELSERLGFSEPSAFYRAFRRWTGRTTRRYRKLKRS
jgi:AraC-like DNA-binding protein